MSLRVSTVLSWAMALGVAVAWWLGWLGLAHAWAAREEPWLARLFDAHTALIMFALCWMVCRDTRRHPRDVALMVVFAAMSLVQLRLTLFLGASLQLLAVIALMARPWPNRAIMARCMALGGLAVGINAAVG